MRIYFLRHGEAGVAASDTDRALTEIGSRDSSNIASLCRRSLITFTHVLTSPILRAKQTAVLAIAHQPAITMEESEFLTPNADPKNLIQFLRSFTTESHILCVTHEPFAGTCISSLISGTESSQIVMKPASMACVETYGAPSRGNGRLLWLINPDMVRNIL
jgi:phosphohistidine phosphatase